MENLRRIRPIDINPNQPMQDSAITILFDTAVGLCLTNAVKGLIENDAKKAAIMGGIGLYLMSRKYIIHPYFYRKIAEGARNHGQY